MSLVGGIHGQRMFLNNEQRKTLSQLLLQHVKNGKLKKGTREMVASLYSVSKSVVDGIWRQTKESGDASHRKTKNCGRKRIELDPAKFCDVPFSKRTSYRSLAFALNINRTSLCRLTKEGSIRRHSNPIKPSLREENKVARLKFCLSMLQSESIPHDPIFKSMHDIVHIDEKWFYLTKKTVKYYMLPHENDPIRSCHSKNFIQKVMFLTAIARPRFDAQGNELFSGKIGIFPFVTKEAAKRRSRNRAAGTLETKSIHSVTKEVSRKFLIEKVVPAIKAKWPTDTAHGPIYIQQDNARSHIDKNDVEFCQVAKEDGFDIRLMCQPANSPDMNVLDLGFFNAIQSLQHKEAPKTIDDLIFAVENAFDTFSSTDSNKIFLTLQTCMIEVMKEKGSINYKTPHIKKDVLQRQGQLPTQMRCERSLVEEVIRYLRGDDNSDMFEEAMLQ